MEQRGALMVIWAMTTGLALMAIAGHNPLTGREVLAVSGSHGLNTGDVLPLGAWTVVTVCCAILWRGAD